MQRPVSEGTLRHYLGRVALQNGPYSVDISLASCLEDWRVHILLRTRFALWPFLPGHADAVAGRVFLQRLQVAFVAWFAGEEGEALVAGLGEQLRHFGPSFCRGKSPPPAR